MAGGFPIADGGASAANVVNAGQLPTAANRLAVGLGLPSVEPKEVGAVRIFQENDPGDILGTPDLQSAECDDDYRLRTSLDTVLDVEQFNYAAQNTGKFSLSATTMTVSFGVAGYTTNASGITTTTTGAHLRTWGTFGVHGTRRTYVEQFVGFSGAPPSNTQVSFGLFLPSSPTNPFPITDGVYVECNNGAWSLNAMYNGNLTGQSAAFAFTPTANQKYKFCLSVSQNDVELWIDDVKIAVVNKAPDNSGLFCATQLNWGFRHVIAGGAAGAVFSCTVGSYFISVGGGGPAGFDAGIISQGAWGSYQGGSGGTMGSQANIGNNTVPSAGTPTNTTSAVLTGFGGAGQETDSLAAGTDGIIMSYQVPAVAVNANIKRLAIYGVRVWSWVQTAHTGGGYVAFFTLCWGGTGGVSLAGAEGTASKAFRRKGIGAHAVASGAVANTLLGEIRSDWKKPIILNPGEYLVVAKRKIGTAPSPGANGFLIDFDYEWF